MSASPEHDEFDPYRIWLGIPKSEQPPTYYRLLGLAEFETDPLVIQEGADRQSVHLRSKQIGSRMAASQKLLAEVATAMGCLLNAESKAKYDRQLRAKQQAELSAAEISTPVIAASFPVAQAMPVAPVAPPQPYPQVIPASPPQPFYQTPTYQAPPYQTPAFQTPPQPVFDFQPATPAPPAPASAATKPGLDPQLLKLIGLGVAGVVGLFTFVLVGGVIYWMSRKPAPEIAQPPVPPATAQQNPPTKPGPENPFESNVSPRDKSLQRKPNPFPSTPPNVVTSIPPSVPKSSTPTGPPPTPTTVKQRPANLVPPARSNVDLQTVQNSAAAVKDSIDYLGALFAHLEVAYLNSWNAQAAEKHAKLWRNVLENPTATTVGSMPQNSALMPEFKEKLLAAAWEIDRRAQVDMVTNKQVFPKVPGALLVRLCVPTREVAPVPQGSITPINGRDQFDERLGIYINQLAGHAKNCSDNTELHDRLLYQAAIASVIRYGYQRGLIEQLIACQLLEQLVTELMKVAPERLQPDVVRLATDEVFAGAGLTKTGEDVRNDPRKQFTVASVVPHTTYLWHSNGRWVDLSGNTPTATYMEVDRTRTTIVLQPMEQPGQKITLTLDFCEVGPMVNGSRRIIHPGFRHGQWEIVRSDRHVIGLMRPPFPHQAENGVMQFFPKSEQALMSPGPNLPGMSGSASPPIPRVANGANVPPDANERFLPRIGDQKPGRAVVSPQQLKPGSRVHIHREGWLTGQVLAVEDGLVRVRYDNQDSSYDEAVVTRRTRIMIGPDGIPLVAGGPNAPPLASGAGGVSSTPSGPSLTPGIPNTDPKRRLWSHAQGFVAMNSDGTWNELTPAGNYYTLSLKSITDEYLELQREGKAGSIRLFNKHMEHSPRTYNTFSAGPKGGWITPLEEVEFDPAQQAAIKKTVDQYAEALTKARELLLERFESAINNNSSRIGKAEERLAYISVLEAEQTRFKTDGLVPFSQPMRQAAVDYISAINRAKGQAEPMFNKAIEHFISKDQLDTAYAVRVLRQRTLAPLLLMKLVRIDNGRPSTSPISIGAGAMTQEDRQVLLAEEPAVPIRLWSGNALIHTVGDARWSADNGGVNMTCPREKNITIKDKLVFNDHGNEFAAQTQQVPSRAQPQKYNGGVLNMLETYERRPEISFVPKGLPMPAAEGAAPATEAAVPEPAPDAGPVEALK